MEKNITRRSFLKATGAAAAFTIVPRQVLGMGYQAPSDTVNLVAIGVGNQGGADIQNIMTPDVPLQRSAGLPGMAMSGYAGLTPQRQVRRASDNPVQEGDAGGRRLHHANIYAICDVDWNYAARIMNGYPKAKRYHDWREMLEKERNNIDAALIATPDHNHAMIASHFMKAGKAVFVEKPMAKTIYECRYLAQLAKETGVVTQMGNQGHNVEGTYQTIEWIQSGLIGDVTEVHMWSNRPMWKQGYFDRPAEEAIPEGFDYDVWLGPAPKKPYAAATTHFAWRGLWDYGTGAMGDMGAHTFDAPILALNLGLPTKIQATTTPFNTEYLPQCEFVEYQFANPDPKKKTPIRVTWSDGGIKPYRPLELEDGRQLRECLYIGTKGMIMHGTHGASPELVPADPNFVAPAKTLERPDNIYVDFINAIKEGRKAKNDFEISSKLTEIMLLTNIAVVSQQINTTLEYDAANMKITNLPEANDYFTMDYRDGWKLA